MSIPKTEKTAKADLWQTVEALCNVAYHLPAANTRKKEAVLLQHAAELKTTFDTQLRAYRKAVRASC